MNTSEAQCVVVRLIPTVLAICKYTYTEFAARIGKDVYKRQVIDGVSKLHPCEHTIIPDRILASTYMSLGAVSVSYTHLDVYKRQIYNS